MRGVVFAHAISRKKEEAKTTPDSVLAVESSWRVTPALSLTWLGCMGTTPSRESDHDTSIVAGNVYTRLTHRLKADASRLRGKMLDKIIKVNVQRAYCKRL